MRKARALLATSNHCNEHCSSWSENDDAVRCHAHREYRELFSIPQVVAKSERTITIRFRQGRVKRMPRTPIQRAPFYWPFFFYCRGLPTRPAAVIPGPPRSNPPSPMHFIRATSVRSFCFFPNLL